MLRDHYAFDQHRLALARGSGVVCRGDFPGRPNRAFRPCGFDRSLGFLVALLNEIDQHPHLRKFPAGIVAIFRFRRDLPSAVRVLLGTRRSIFKPNTGLLIVI